jgi:hypothetical protein
MRFRDWVIRNIVSPYGLATISYAFFLFSCLIPPSVYSSYIHEPDLMFLDPATILFYTLCVAAFLTGVWLMGWLFPSAPLVERKFEARFNPATFLLIPLVLCTALSVLSSVLLVKNNPSLIPLLLAQEAGFLRADDGSGLQFQGTLNITVLFLTGIIWWVAWRYQQSGIRGRGRRMVQCALALAVLALFISSSLNLSRHPFIVLASGLAVSYPLRKVFTRQLSRRLIVETVFVFVTGGALFFFLVNWLRGGRGGSHQIDAFVGYTIASYNRLSALLQGKLHFEYPGRGIYFSNFLSFNHTLNSILPFDKYMNVPDYFDWWRSSFSSVGRAGLDADMGIFCGTFGEIYIEMGWLTPLYVFVYGLLYGLVWRWMKKGRLAGIILYPYFAYCILFWFTTNGLFELDVVALIVDVMILGAYEFLFVSEGKMSAPVSQTS